MPKKLPRQFIDDLIARNDIVSLIEQHVPLKKAGGSYKGLCPFHNEKTPSFNVNPNKQLYHCFGCGASGNIISFLMDYEHLRFPDAIETLAQMAGVEIPATLDDPHQASHKRLFEVMEKAQQFYSVMLKKSGDEALAYLTNRGLSEETMTRFKVGFVPAGWDHAFNALTKRQYTQKELLDCGLLTQNETGRVYDRFRSRVMFPIHDRRGRVIAFGGRVIDPNESPKYLNSPETPIFHKSHELYGLYEAREHDRKLDHLLVVEGYMDVIALANHGVNNAVATLGTAVTGHHVKRLLRTCPKLSFCFDGDQAGRNAAWKALDICLQVMDDKHQVRFLFLPDGEDPDTFVNAHGEAGFRAALSKAKPISEFFFDHLSEQVNLETLEGRVALSSLVVPYIQKVRAPILKSLLQNELGTLAHALADDITDWVANVPQQAAMAAVSKPAPKGQQTPMRLAITILLQHPDFTQKLEIPTFLYQATLPGLEVLKALLGLLKDNPSITSANLLERWRGHKTFAYLGRLAHEALLVPESGLMTELQDALCRVETLCRDAEIDALMRAMADNSAKPETRSRLQTLLSEKNPD
jgi:DNA primase